MTRPPAANDILPAFNLLNLQRLEQLDRLHRTERVLPCAECAVSIFPYATCGVL
jgi:hypothetical protein